MSDSRYNFIYSRLVEDENDLLGIIAYSIYKREKIEYIKRIKSEENREPSQEEMNHFWRTSNLQSSIDSYKLKAENISKEFGRQLLEGRTGEIEQEYKNKLIAKVESFRHPFWNGVLQNFIASLLFIFLIGAIVFTSWSVKYGLKNVAEEMFGVKISQKEQQTANQQQDKKQADNQ